jgi:hypothetical protein
MGYTNYWNLKKKTKKTAEQVKIAFNEVAILFDKLPQISTNAGGYYTDEPLRLRGGDGTGKMHISDDALIFNGDAKQLGGCHETFYIDLTNSETLLNASCKTIRKPYDFAVCVALLAMANHIDGFTFSTDGDLEDWKPAIDFYNTHIGYISENLKLNVSALRELVEA